MIVYRVEFDDFEAHFDDWLEKVIEEDSIVIITAEDKEFAAVVPYEWFAERNGEDD